MDAVDWLTKKLGPDVDIYDIVPSIELEKEMREYRRTLPKNSDEYKSFGYFLRTDTEFYDECESC